MKYVKGPNNPTPNAADPGVKEDIRRLRLSHSDITGAKRETERIRRMRDEGIAYQVMDSSGPLKRSYSI